MGYGAEMVPWDLPFYFNRKFLFLGLFGSEIISLLFFNEVKFRKYVFLQNAPFSIFVPAPIAPDRRLFK